ncbi:unnamed protein product [Tilletia laevis]|uniref:Uncharacterized protein n=2 Tax=Tilletia TaxID=13289 RepID=A0A177UJJ7_9BASI|nr:hypothetical protein CF336_g5216 [Tilletia laevis]KAE8258105.1 hypothetical protein A4X03_0g4480 [Tilletia caries]CAD6898668.1 unnamed protein product [Tilletia controversa]KAE8197871.1 hypothetical protein CF335_g4516 [Tilletia laevis]CAD6886748.1 unnamed protein product [Tilletia caries]
MKLTVASVLALVGAVSAATDGPYGLGQAPSGFIKGVLNTSLSCNISALGILPLGQYQIPFGVSAVLPDKVNANQPFNVIAGTRLIVPQSVNFLAALFGARFYGGVATKVIVNAAGASPAFIDAAKSQTLTIPQAPINANGVSVLELPGNGNIITVGPFTGATAKSSVVLSFGDIAATIDTFNATGSKTFITAFVVCPAAQRPTSLAFVNTGGSGSTATITPPASTKAGDIKTVPANSTAGIVGLTYQCDFSGFVQGAVRISVGGFKPSNAAINSGDKIVISQGQGNVYLTKKLISDIKAIVSIADSTKITLSTLNFKAINATPATKNALPDGFTTTAKLNTNAIVVPNGAPSKTLPDIVFTAGKSGSTALISLADVAGNASLLDADGNEILAIDFTCAALSPATGLLPFDIL